MGDVVLGLASSGSTDDAVALASRPEYDNPDLQQRIAWDLADGAARAGSIDAFMRAIARIDTNTAIGSAHYGVFHLLAVGRRTEALALLESAYPQLWQAYLDQSVSPDTSWIQDFIDVGYTTAATELVQSAADAVSARLNDQPLDTDEYKWRPGLLVLATLFRQSIELGLTDRAIEYANRLKSPRQRDHLLALCVDALAIAGREADAMILADRLPSYPIDSDFEARSGLQSMNPPDYAWGAIGLSVARTGDLARAYRIAVIDHQSTINIATLIAAFRENR